jgi:hypothetical protein
VRGEMLRELLDIALDLLDAAIDVALLGVGYRSEVVFVYDDLFMFMFII